ncbi:MAG: hypothetical protein D6758_12390 [Gammaproteobacteria bacterium]|nr:MAG: hypothetical protein D6758_12390 [Gammaproteobacteria bacterium]
MLKAKGVITALAWGGLMAAVMTGIYRSEFGQWAWAVWQARHKVAEVGPPEKGEVTQTVSAENERARWMREWVQRLREDYGRYLGSLNARVELRDLRDTLIKAWPEDGESRFRELIETAFPREAADILDLIARMDVYDAWLIEQLVALNHMDPLSRQETLWAKRRELFAEQAEQLWQDEIQTREARAQVMQRTVALLDKATDTPVEERLYLLKTTLDETYGDSLEAPLISTGLVSKVFFSLESVQKDLKALAPEERQARINALRKQMGLTDAQVQALAHQDQKREKRWSNGEAYMAARRELEARFDGKPPEPELQKVREQFFGPSAVTIAREEAQGFYRFERPRYYGRN